MRKLCKLRQIHIWNKMRNKAMIFKVWIGHSHRSAAWACIWFCVRCVYLVSSWVPRLTKMTLRTDASWPSNVFKKVVRTGGETMKQYSYKLDLTNVWTWLLLCNTIRLLWFWHVDSKCPTLRQLKSCRLHSLAVPSAEVVASTWSTGEKQTAQMPRRWPRNTPSRLTVPSPVKDHSLAVRSWEPEASSLSLGDTATLFTSWRHDVEGRGEKDQTF